MNEPRTMALTGLGIVAPTGTEKNSFFRYLREPFNADEAAGRAGGPAPGRLLKHLNLTHPKLKIARYMDPVSKNAIVALGAAITDAGLDESDIAHAPHAYGLVLGTRRGARETRRALYESLASKQGKLVSGTVFSHCGYNIAGAIAAVAYGIKGPNLTLAGREQVGMSLLQTARRLMESSRAHTVFVGFTECDSARAQGNGAFGEMAYVLCLERNDRAMERGAVVRAGVHLQDADGDLSVGDGEAIVGVPFPGASFAAGAEPLPLALPGLTAVDASYAALIKIGLLAHDQTIKARFPEAAFTAPVGKNRTEVRLRYAEKEVVIA